VSDVVTCGVTRLCGRVGLGRLSSRLRPAGSRGRAVTRRIASAGSGCLRSTDTGGTAPSRPLLAWRLAQDDRSRPIALGQSLSAKPCEREARRGACGEVLRANELASLDAPGLKFEPGDHRMR
jgi:hypothetical protein